MSFMNPEEIIQSLHIVPGEHIADFGSGNGAFTFPIAQALEHSGTVYAVDVNRDMLTKLANEGVRAGHSTIKTMWANIEQVGGVKLQDSALDGIVFSNVLFQLEDKEGAIRESFRLLKQGGRVLVIDWSDSFGGMGPSFMDIVPKQKAKNMFSEAGFTIAADTSVGDHHYGFIAIKH